VQNGGVGTLNLTLSSGTTYGGTIANASSGTMTVNSAAGTNTITALTSSGANGKMNFSGAGSVNNVAGTFQGNNAASTNTFVSGTWYFGAPGNSGSSSMGTLSINGAFVSFAGGRYWSSVGSVINLQSGTLQALGDRFSLGADYSGNISINVSGGLLDVAKSQYGFSMGAGTASGGNQSITQTGGTVQYGFTLGLNPAVKSLIIGAASGKTGTNTYSLAGGVLRSQFTISGNATQTASIQSRFNWTGGTLAGLGIDMTNLGSSDGITTYASGILLNGGGTLAPGDIGTAGKTTITGSYSNAPTATLAIDIGGAKQGDAFTNAPGYYDTLRVDVGATTLAGQLRVNLINSYVPLTTNRFTVLLCTNGLFGTFANVTDKILPLADGYSLFTNVTQNTTNVILSGYAVNEYLGGSWDNASSWSQSVIPANQDYAAYFGTLASAFSPNVGTRTLKGLVFANTSSFTLSGTALTLQGDASIKVTTGSHTISVPMALSNATEIAVTADSVLTLAGNVTGAQNVNKTGTGTLALGGANTLLGALTVSEGTVKQTAGTTTLSGLTLAGGTYDLWAGTLLIAEGVAGGAIDTIAEVEAAITAGTIKGRGQTRTISEFKISVIDGTVKVELKMHGTVISFQ
jgi:autotransporter-associated beta strand protein